MAIGWLFILFVLIMLLIILRFLFGKGKPVLSEPYCAKCGYDLRVNWNSSMICPECGADLKAKNAVNFGKAKGRSNRALIVFLIVFMLVFFLFFTLAFSRGIRTGTVTGPAAVSNLPTANLIANLPTQFDDAWTWRELGKRCKAGNLSSDEVDELITQIIIGLKCKPIAQRGPIAWGQELIGQLITDQVIDGKRLSELMGVYYGDGPTIFKPVSSSVPAGWSAVHARFAHTWPLGSSKAFRPHCKLISVTLGDEAKTPLLFVPENMTHWHQDIKPLPSMRISFLFGDRISVKNSLPKGEYVVNFIFITELFPTVPNDKEPADGDVPIASVTHVESLRVIVDETGRMQFQPQDKSKDR